MKNLLAIFYGIVFGIANIIPGVSGGTMLIVFGCYDKVCGALSLNFKEIKKNIVFLIFFGIGTLIGIVGFSFAITFLFDRFPVPTYLFFMGLILGSIPLIIRNATVKEKFRPSCAFPFVIALVAVLGLTFLEKNSAEPYTLSAVMEGNTAMVTIFNDSDRTVDSWTIELPDGASAETKVTGAESDTHYSTMDKIKGIFGMKIPALAPNMFRNPDGAVIEPHSAYSFTFENNSGIDLSTLEIGEISYRMDVPFFLTMVGALFVAAIAMIIPGVSGSFVMMTLGVYTTIIAAIKNFDFGVIIPCAIGAIIGLIFGARLISWALKKWRLMVYSAILGLAAGSLAAIFPVGYELSAGVIIAAAIAFIAGGALALLIGKKTPVEAE
ncbi:MAG: DUF368 domain-containing protein [Ruminiclostridium sp.]